MWVGIAGSTINDSTEFMVALSVHDGVYTTDYSAVTIPYVVGEIDTTSKDIEKLVLKTLREFSDEHLCKFLGAGVTLSLLREVRIYYFSSFTS